MSKRDLILELNRIGAVKFGEFTLKSGMKSPIYIDLRILVTYPDALKRVARAMASVVKRLPCDRIAAIPYAALPLGVMISQTTKLPLIYARREVKDYGTKKMVEGEYRDGETVVVIDDLITTGLSKFETIQPFEQLGLRVKDIVVLIDREQGGPEKLAESGFTVHSILKISKMLKGLKDEGKITPELYEDVKAYLRANRGA